MSFHRFKKANSSSGRMRLLTKQIQKVDLWISRVKLKDYKAIASSSVGPVLAGPLSRSGHIIGNGRK